MVVERRQAFMKLVLMGATLWIECLSRMRNVLNNVDAEELTPNLQ